jgi:cytolysin-activating lysine-acyltransferase
MPNKTKEANKQQVVNDNNSNIPGHIAMESAIGSVLMIAAKSPNHKYLFSADYEWMIIPAITTRQFVLFRNKNNEPIAFVSFASVNEEIEKRLLEGTKKLTPKDWQSGDKLYIIDIISPFAPASQILKELSEKQFKDKEINLLKPSADKKTITAASLKDVINELDDANNKAKKSA